MRASRSSPILKSMLLCSLFAVAGELVNAAELAPETVKAWDAYVRRADARMHSWHERDRPFLWSDGASDWGQRLRQGEVLAAPLAGHGTVGVPHGLIHHWTGAIFIPSATLESVLDVIHDYSHYKEFYKPFVVYSQLNAKEDGAQKFTMRWIHHVLFVTAAVETEYEAQEFALDRLRWYDIADATRVQEIADYGQPGEHLLPPGQGNGFIWRLHGLVRCEQRDGGVYVELEAMVLSRDIPIAFRWLVKPVVERLSRNSLLTSLEQTRAAVEKARTPVSAVRP
jgi:hypothetical protein